MLDIMGVAVKDIRVDYGMEYIFNDGDNIIVLDLTELTIDEFYSLSVELDDFEEYDLIKPYGVRTITGYDWNIVLGKDKPNVKKIFKTIELIGKRYTGEHYPDIMYYDYKDKRMHKHYREWIEFMGYELINEGKVAMYHRIKNDIQQ